MDGFIPGEGAAFCVLSGEPSLGAGPESSSTVRLRPWTRAIDTGRRRPRVKASLTHSAQLRQRSWQLPAPIGTTFAGFNGESFDAKIWGVARLRHNDLFSPSMAIEHPADKYGDAGAATGAILLALAAKSLTSGGANKGRR